MHNPSHDPRRGSIKRIVNGLRYAKSEKTRRVPNSKGYCTYRVFLDIKECKWVILVIEGATHIRKKRRRRVLLHGTVVVINFKSMFVITQYAFKGYRDKYKHKYLNRGNRELLPSEFPAIQMSELVLRNSNGNHRG